jgi:hypothetical protein
VVCCLQTGISSISSAHDPISLAQLVVIYRQSRWPNLLSSVKKAPRDIFCCSFFLGAATNHYQPFSYTIERFSTPYRPVGDRRHKKRLPMLAGFLDTARERLVLRFVRQSRLKNMLSFRSTMCLFSSCVGSSSRNLMWWWSIMSRQDRP